MEETQAADIREDVRFVGEPAELAALFLNLAKAQGEFLPMLKDSTAKVTMKAGGSYTFDYAGLDVLIAATQPALTKYELGFFQAPVERGNALLSVLAHGLARIECVSPITGWDTPQEFGSAITYAKRYARGSILSVFPAGEDDDAGAAAGHQTTVTPRHAQRPPDTRTVAKNDSPAITPQTKKEVSDLAKAAGFAVPELEEFSKKNGTGLLKDLTEVNGLLLRTALEGLGAQ